MMTCCIIDDEPHAIRSVERCIAAAGGLQLVFTEDDPVKGLRRLAELSAWPDIVFCDIDMPEFTGLELGRLVNRKSQLVYITAHARYAIEAFERNAVDYLLKPISQERFNACIERCTERREGSFTRVEEERAQRSVFLHTSTVKGNYVSILLNELVYIRSRGNNLLFHTLADTEEEVYMTFKDAERMLDPKCFQRVHRSYIVNVDLIESIRFGKVILRTGHSIDLTSGYRKDFFRSLGNRVLKSSR